MGKSKKIEHLVEGKPICLVKEFFAELRLQGISHLGQVENAIIKTNGGISVFFYPDEEVKYGLPIMPESLDKQHRKINVSGHYACIFCGCTKKIEPALHHICPTCKKDKWIEATNKKRVS